MNSKELKTMLTVPYQTAFSMLDRLEQQFSTLSCIPAAEVLDTKEHYLIRLELPGADKDSIDVKATESSLTITADRKNTTDVKKMTPLISELREESWRRTFNFVNTLNRDNLQAVYKDGVLEITAGKAQMHTSVKIKVED
tara:strand:+ start:72 stop:491 length:420 start_codon:yes stop_codon:yes gene_type:complete